MPRFQIPQSTIRPASGVPNIQVEPGSLVRTGEAEVARSMGSVGQAIGDAGQLVAAYAQKLQKAKDSTHIIDYDFKYNDAFQTYKDSVTQSPVRMTLEQREADFGKFNTSFNRQIDNDKLLSNNAKEAIGLNFKQQSQRRWLEIKAYENGRSRVELDATLMANQNQALRDGDEAKASAILDERYGLGLYNGDARQVQAEKEHFGERMEVYRVDDLIQDNPKEAYDLLREKTEKGYPKNYKKLRDENRRGLEAKARGAQNRWYEEQYQILAEKQRKGQMTIADWEVTHKEGLITDQRMREVMRTYETGQAKYTYDDKLATQIDETIKNITTNDSAAKRVRTLIANSSFAPEVKQDWEQAIEEKIKHRDNPSAPVYPPAEIRDIFDTVNDWVKAKMNPPTNLYGPTPVLTDDQKVRIGYRAAEIKKVLRAAFDAGKPLAEIQKIQLQMMRGEVAPIVKTGGRVPIPRKSGGMVIVTTSDGRQLNARMRNPDESPYAYADYIQSLMKTTTNQK